MIVKYDRNKKLTKIYRVSSFWLAQLLEADLPRASSTGSSITIGRVIFCPIFVFIWDHFEGAYRKPSGNLLIILL